LNSGLCASLEPYLQSILLWLFLDMGSLVVFARAGLEPNPHN
jgi:hypothetical protein